MAMINIRLTDSFSACAVNHLFGIPFSSTQKFAQFFKADALRFRHYEDYPDQLQYHHKGEKDEYGPWIVLEYTDVLIQKCRGEQSDQCSKDPVCAGTPRLTIGPHLVGENLGNEHPDNGTLPNSVRCNEN